MNNYLVKNISIREGSHNFVSRELIHPNLSTDNFLKYIPLCYLLTLDN